MRLRNVRGSRETLEESQFTINEPREWKGKWNEFFGNDNPICLEIGTGKGKFLTTLAQNHPDVNYVGIEKYSSVLVRAIEKQKELALDNLVFIRMEAEYVEDIFAQGEVRTIYLNFSDPWPKDRHAKRRLPSRQFFARYHKILAPQGKVEFKTDNRILFDFALEEVVEAGWTLEAHSFDLHNSDMNEGNVMTEYETKFSEMGTPINKLIASR